MKMASSALLGVTVLLGAGGLGAQTATPTPPTPGAPGGVEVPTLLPTPFPEAEPSEAVDLAGFRGGFFIRDARDQFHLYPRGLFQVDFNSSFGPGVTQAKDPELRPHVAMGRARLGLGGDAFRRLSFLTLVDFSGQAASGTVDAGARTVEPANATRSTAPVRESTGMAALADVWINYRACECFNFMVGHFDVPFSMENRTPQEAIPWMNRNIAIRGFAVPSAQDTGAMIWGEVGPKVFGYEIGVFGGDGQNRPSVDALADWIGRIYWRPFAVGGSNSVAKSAQVGVSARHGERDPAAVGYDVAPIATGQGFALWRPLYTDSRGRLIHVIPSGAQNAIGGEVSGHGNRIGFQGEAYYVVNNTREAADGFQLKNTERFGQMAGASWYAQLSAWPLGDAFVAPEPGVERPRRLEGRGAAQLRHGVEVMAMAAGVHANYKGGTRLGSTSPSSNILVVQLGLGVQYWHSAHLRVGLNYVAYVAPGSGSTTNQVVVPGNLLNGSAATASGGHVLHELGLRLSVSL